MICLFYATFVVWILENVDENDSPALGEQCSTACYSMMMRLAYPAHNFLQYSISLRRMSLCLVKLRILCIVCIA